MFKIYYVSDMPDLRFDKEKNKVVISDYEINQETGEIFVSPVELRNVLMEHKAEAEQIKELEMMIHELRKDRLVNIANFLAKMHEISKGIEGARSKLENDKMTMTDVKRCQAIAKTWVDQKNTLKESRYVVGLIQKEEKALRARKARLEAGFSD
jgi:septal ring factor EnvC (AmiA/AmiB activator)